MLRLVFTKEASFLFMKSKDETWFPLDGITAKEIGKTRILPSFIIGQFLPP